MVCLEKLDRSDFEEVYRIMEQSFPADERRKKIVGKIWHMLFCGTVVAYMYTLIMIVYYSREPGSRTGVADMVLWSTWCLSL